jgi:hypothetical protein
MARSIASRLDKLEALAAEMFAAAVAVFWLEDPERDPDEYINELIASGKCSPDDDVRLVRWRSEAEELAANAG